MPASDRMQRAPRLLVLLLGLLALGTGPRCAEGDHPMSMQEWRAEEATVALDGVDADDEQAVIHQPITLYVAGIPLHVVIGPHSEGLAVGLEQCEELRAQGAVTSQDLAACSEEFARSLRPHISELREDYAHRRERSTFENEAQASFLQTIDLAAALKTAQEACLREGAVGVVGVDWLFNPEQPEVCGVEHDKIFASFRERRTWLPLPGFVSDFLGTRTAYELDCEHPSVVPSRRLDCEMGLLIHSQNLWLQPVRPSYPALDEEYFEWLDVLKAVDNAQSMEGPGVLVVVEVGAGHGPWAVRAWRANELLHRRPLQLVLVEPHPASVARAYQHMAINMVDAANFTIWQAALGPEAGKADFSTSACSLTTGHSKPLVRPSSAAVDGGRLREWADADGAGGGESRGGGGAQGAAAAAASERAGAKAHESVASDDPALLPVELVTLDMVLAGFSQVHLLDVDIQGVEMHVIPAARQLLLRKVHRLHIGTHHISIHQAIRAVLREDNWTLHADYPPLSSIRTPFGWTSFRDGVLTAINPLLG